MIEDQEPSRSVQIEPIRRDQPQQPPAHQAPANIAPKPIQTVPILTPRSQAARWVGTASRAKPTPAPKAEQAPPPPASGGTRQNSDFDDLASWDVGDPNAPAAAIEDVFDELSDQPSRSLQSAAARAHLTDPDDPPAEPSPADEPQTDATPEPAASPPPPADEFSARPLRTDAKIQWIPKLNLKTHEKIGIIAFAILLVGGAAWAYHSSVSRLAEGKPDPISKLPAQGSHVTITKVETYWRAPITSGDDRETVRRGVELIPVAEITATGEGAIRVIFSNDRNTDVGDPATRKISGETTLVIPATAGFDDTGSHAAYQAGLTKHWHVNIAEADSATAGGSDFKPVSRIAIGPTLR